MDYVIPLTYSKIVAITPSDTVDIPPQTNFGTDGSGSEGSIGTAPNAIWIGGAGNLAGQVNGVVAPIVPVALGQVVEIRFTRILATGTTATNIYGLWL
jgi:hypothetical protein